MSTIVSLSRECLGRTENITKSPMVWDFPSILKPGFKGHFITANKHVERTLLIADNIDSVEHEALILCSGYWLKRVR